MRPEKSAKKDAAKYTALGIPEEWVVVFQKAGYNKLTLKDVNPNKLIKNYGINKKFNLN